MSKTIERSARVNFSAMQMFDLVNDIESYPQFMPGCSNATILSRTDNTVTARLDLAKAGLHQSFTTRNTLTPPERIDLDLVEGPFKSLHGTWHFRAIDDTSCSIHFRLEYHFSNFLLGLAAGKLMDHVASDQVNAVCQRARIIYGD